MNQAKKEISLDQLPVPSQGQLALAIAIVNSKPANVPVIDHLQQIREHIKGSIHHSPKSSSLTSSSDKYFDSVAFWKQAYTKAEATQSELNDRIYELEQRVQTLKLKLKQEDNDCDTPERDKRKESKEPAAPDSQRKRKKTNNTPKVGSSSEAELDRLSELICQENLTNSKINSVMRHLSALQQNMQKKPTWPAIYSNVLDLCVATCSVVSCLYERSGSESRQSNSADNIRVLNPIVVLAVIESAHTTLCRALNKIANSSESKKYEGQVTYHLISIFEAVLYALAKLCDPKTGSKEPPKLKQSSKSLSAKNTMQQPSAESDTLHCGIPPDEILQILRSVLAGMMLKATTLITASPNNVFEGYLYVFLTRVGTVLSVLEFKDIVTSPDLQISSDKLPLPDGLRRAGIGGNDAIEAALQAYEKETYHLVWILEKAVALVHSISMKSSLSHDTTNASDGKGSNAGLLLSLSKKRLQNTLLMAVFHEEEPLFLESLKKPHKPAGDELKVEINKHLEPPSEWFSREVWRLLGWDILESIWKNGSENHKKC